MSNVKSTISAHNKKILNPQKHMENTRSCNCIRKEQCPMQQNCLSHNNIIYEATIAANNNQPVKKYIGLCEITFKKRYANHKNHSPQNQKNVIYVQQKSSKQQTTTNKTNSSTAETKSSPNADISESSSSYFLTLPTDITPG